ncbi:GNAT family N-acetyltransferase [Bacillus sp. BGMRC 2118]|nr:GNAT family N-acetyltransferase [Bacillus sp. BGMRC 2118]
MILHFKKASDIEISEIYELAGINRLEATNFKADDNQQKMIEAYEHSIKHGAYFLCLMNETQLIGWVQIDKSFDYLTGNEIGWINDVYVKKEYRGNGFAKKLLQESLRHFKEKGYEDVSLNVYSHNEVAISLYRSLGFKETNFFMKLEL